MIVDTQEPTGTLEQRPQGRYAPAQIRMHWIVAVFVAAQLILGIRIGTISYEAEDKSLLSQLLVLHLIIGTVIFGLMVVRLKLRRQFGAPPSPNGTPFEASIFAKINHYGFYLLLLLMPIIGWLAYTTDKPGAALFGNLHAALALVLLLAIGAHLAGVIYHSFIRRDSILERMAMGKFDE